MELEMEQSKGIGGKVDSKKGTYLVWKDLSVIIPTFGSAEPARKLLQGLNGYAEPGRIMAIMGPSGSGKSTLLDSLAGRLSTNVTMTGDILINGKKEKPGFGHVAYVTQEDVLLGTLTVRETITYSALLRLPNAMSKKEIVTVAEEIILEMGLEDCADRLTGDWHIRGISGGEKKRVSIALEILTKPRLLFLDEPTSGLDSASAFFVVQTLRAISQDGRTVVSSIHQPSSEVFTLFDDLFLLSSGECVYFGDAKKAIEFFAEAGVPCPSRRSPSDHFLRCINSDFDVVTSTLKGSQRYYITQKLSDPLVNMATVEIRERLIRTYKSSKYVKQTHNRIQELLRNGEATAEIPKDSKASWGKQLVILTQRSFLNMTRDKGYYWLRIAIYIILSFCVGTVYFNVGTSYTAILARGACGGFITGFMTFMSIGGFPSFVEEMKIFYKEWRNGHYGVAVFILSNFLSSFPFLVAVAASSGTITYFMVQFHPGFSHYIYFVIVVFLSVSIVESCMMVVASLVPNFLMGIITGAGVIGIMMMTSGFFQLLPDLPKPIWRYPISYFSYGCWALQGHYKNDLLGLEFDPLTPGDPKLSGEYIVTQLFKVSLDHSKWWDVAALVALLVFFRLAFFVILKLKEKLIPLIQSARSKKAQNDLKKLSLVVKVPSFRIPSMRVSSGRHSSRRHDLPPLSSQEGLASPIHE